MPRCALALALAALLATACGERYEPTGALAQTYPITVRGAGDEPTTAQSRPRTIVAVGRGPAELLAALGVKAQAFAGRGALDLDAVVRARPDLVVASEDTDPFDLGQIKRSSRSAVYVSPGSSVADVERAAVDLGFLVGRPVEARHLAARIEAGIARVRAHLAGVTPVDVFVDTGFYTTVGAQSLLGDLIRLAGGRNVAAARAGEAPFTPRRIAKLDPDLYLVTSSSGVGAAALRTDPEARLIPAVRRGRIAVIPSDLVQVAGPRVPAGLAALARTLHPDAFR